MGKNAVVEEKKDNPDAPITVKEFIELLKQVDQDAVVSIISESGYEEEECILRRVHLSSSIYIKNEIYPFSTYKENNTNYFVIKAYDI